MPPLGMKRTDILLAAALGLIMSAITVHAVTPVVVQHAYVESNNARKVKLTFPRATAPGDLLVVMAGWTSGVYLSRTAFEDAVSDNINGDYTSIFSSTAPLLPPNGATVLMAYLPNCKGRKPTVTITLPAHQNNIQLDIVEIRGSSSLDYVSPQQPNVQGTDNGNNNPPISGSYLVANTNTTNGDCIVLGCFSQNVPDAMTLISGIPIDVTPGGNSRFASAYLIAPIGSIPIISGTVSKSVFFAGIAAAFKAE
jgi:hypothetical protein